MCVGGGGGPVAVAVAKQRPRKIAFEDPHGGQNDPSEHRPRVGRRLADDPQDFGGRCLPLQRLLSLVEEARVLDCDRRLVGEALQERDLFLREGPRRRSGDDDRPDAPVHEQHRRIEHSDSAGLDDCGPLVLGQLWLVGKIRHMNRAALGDGETGRTAGERRHVAAPVSSLPSALRRPSDDVPFDEVHGHRLEAKQPLTGTR